MVVDPGEGAAEQLPGVLAEHDMRAVAVLLTHGHLDHMASAAQVQCGRGIPAYLHGADDYMLDDPLAGSVTAVARRTCRDGPVRSATPNVWRP